MGQAVRIIELSEYRVAELEKADLPTELGERLWQTYSAQIEVEFPSPKTAQRWQLTSKGWVGQIPLDASVQLALMPKVPLSNVFGMLEYAYSLKSFRFLDEIRDVHDSEYTWPIQPA